MELDVLERARCGDRDAFRALLAAWGDRVLRTGALISMDRARAEQLAVATFTRVWRELPAMHSERAFRPWLMRALLEALAPEDAAAADDDQADPLRACLARMNAADRATLVLHLYDRMGAAELGPARGTNLGSAARGLRDALRSFKACAAASGIEPDEQRITALLEQMARSVELPGWFASEVIEPRLTEPEGPSVRRLVGVDHDDAWARILDTATVPAWTKSDDVRVRGAARLEAGVRIVTRGRIAGRRPSRDESVIAWADAHTLAWTTRARIRPWSSAIEFRWTLAVAPANGGCELIHSLRGVAFPPGPSGRFLRAAYARVADAMPGSMHAGIEQLAQLLEASARRAAL